ncbi:MAG: DoxX family membrane protein [Chloroflexi bacterium]|nr:DoxX family membrane protein [Chloroflexota bacterium]
MITLRPAAPTTLEGSEAKERAWLAGLRAPASALRRLGASGSSLLCLRVGMGWFMFYAGWIKAYAEDGWSAGRFLTDATQGPFAGVFQAMAFNPVVDGLVIAGEIGVGLALLLGAAVRFAVLSGIAIFVPLYLTHLPPPDGWLSQHIIYILALVVLGATRSGVTYGIDGLLVDWEQRFPALRYLLG